MHLKIFLIRGMIAHYLGLHRKFDGTTSTLSEGKGLTFESCQVRQISSIFSVSYVERLELGWPAAQLWEPPGHQDARRDWNAALGASSLSACRMPIEIKITGEPEEFAELLRSWGRAAVKSAGGP